MAGPICISAWCEWRTILQKALLYYHHHHSSARINDLQAELHLDPNYLRWGDITNALILYADDGCMLSDSPEGLQHCMDTTSAFFMDWNLQLNSVENRDHCF